MLTDTMGRLLYVEDDATVRSSTERWLRTRPFRLQVAPTYAKAIHWSERYDDWIGFIADECLERDKRGFELLEKLRERYPKTPAMLVTGQRTKALDDQCFLHDITFAEKPVSGRVYDKFLEQVAEFRRGAPAVHGRVATFAREIGATSRQTEVLMLAIEGGFRNHEIARRLDVTENTLKKHVRGLLIRADAESLEELRARFRE